MSVVQPEPNNTSTVEPKVKYPAIALYLGGVVILALINAFTGNDNELLIETLPDMIEPFILPIVPVIIQMVTGYFAKHQWRQAEVTGPPSSNTTNLG